MREQLFVLLSWAVQPARRYCWEKQLCTASAPSKVHLCPPLNKVSLLLCAMTHKERGNKWLLSTAGQLIVLWTHPLSLSRPRQNYSDSHLTRFTFSDKLYSLVGTAFCYNEGNNYFPGPVSCHHKQFFTKRKAYSGNWSLSLTSSSSHKTGLGCCCFCLVLYCSSSHILLHL